MKDMGQNYLPLVKIVSSWEVEKKTLKKTKETENIKGKIKC